jgi:hypothetical protein
MYTTNNVRPTNITQSLNSSTYRNRSVKNFNSVRRPQNTFIIPEPPENINPHVNNIEESLDKLMQLGQKGPVHYKTDLLFSLFAYVAVINKFGKQCIPKGSYYFGLIINSNKEETPIFNDLTLLDKFGESIKNCITRNVPIICIDLSLIIEGYKVEHSNLLIYRPFQRIIERFEPHGRGFGNNNSPKLLKADFNINKQLNELFRDKLVQYTNGSVTYVPPNEICLT